jgi:hypothetical protein
MLVNGAFSVVLKRLLCWGVPVFFCWWQLHLSVLMPALVSLENKVLGVVYKQEQVRVNFAAPATINVDTGVIIPHKTDTTGKKRFSWSFKFPVNSALTMGLAITWLLLMAVPQWRWREIGLVTVLLLPLMALNLYAILQEQLSTFLLSLDSRIVMLPHSGALITVPPPAAWVPKMAHVIRLFLPYITCFILPAILAYRINQAS